MSGEVRASLVRLRVELERERGVLRSIVAAASKYAPALAQTVVDAPIVAYLAVEVHRYYTGLENILGRIERVFGVEHEGGDWHLDLLQGVALDLPGVRPPILPAPLLEKLRELMRFRHFFRHAYAVELDRSKLAAVVADLMAIAGPVDQELANFESFLEEAARGLWP